jgi:hypothetical protein
MSIDEKIAAMQGMSEEELIALQGELDKILGRVDRLLIDIGQKKWEELTRNGWPPPGWRPLSEELADVIYDGSDMPEDFALNADHYLYGTPKKYPTW